MAPDLALYVGVYLERLGNRDPGVWPVARSIAGRIRERLEEGMPAGWRPKGRSGSGSGAEAPR